VNVHQPIKDDKMSCPTPKKQKLAEMTAELLKLLPTIAIIDPLEKHTDVISDLASEADVTFSGTELRFKTDVTLDLSKESSDTLNKIIKDVVDSGGASNEDLDTIFDKYGFEPMKPNLARPVKQ